MNYIKALLAKLLRLPLKDTPDSTEGSKPKSEDDREYTYTIRKNEARLKLTQEISKSVYWEIDLRTQTLTLENRLMKLAGYELPGDTIITPFHEFAIKYMHHEDAQYMLEQLVFGLTQLDNPEYGFEKNVRMIGANGGYFYHRISFYTRYQTEKEVVFGCTQDVTTQVREEQEYSSALRKSEASLKLSHQIAQIVHWEWESDTTTLQFDNQLLINAGFLLTPGIMTMPSTEYIRKYVHPDDRQKLFNSQQDSQSKAYESNLQVEITYRIVGPDQKIRYHNVVALTRYNDKPGLFFGIFQDVTERYETIESLKKNEAALQYAQEMNKTVYWELNTETLLLTIDSRLLTIAGYNKPPGIMTIPIQDVIQNYIHPEDAQAMAEATQNAISNLGDPGYAAENNYRLIGANGDIYYHRSVFNIRSQTNKNIVFGVTQDITSQRVAEQQLLQNQKALLESQKKTAEYQLAALRSQMNPHFIFNCLNSIQNFIAKNDKYNAINYLSKFAKLIRLILEGSHDNYILLSDEIKMLEYYAELEQMRFPDKFDFKLELEEELHPELIKIPPMLIQPFVENAILHGLVHKKEKGFLKISFKYNEAFLICEIKDNGIGREEAAKIKAAKTSTHKSVATNLTRERLEMYNNGLTNETELEITDMYDATGKSNGTKVKIYLPLK